MEPIKAHPIAAIVPEMSHAQLSELVADIQQDGLWEPVLLHPDGSIIDGRNRYRACLEPGVAPTFRTWDGQGSLVSLVLSLNLHRRHLNASQRVMAAVKASAVLKEEAKTRQLAPQNNNRGRAVQANLQEREKGQWRDRAGELVNVSPRTLEHASTVVAKVSPN